MNQRFYRIFIVILLALMLTPVMLFSDQEQMQAAKGVKRYAPCFEMSHRTMISRCLNEVYNLRMERCDTFPSEELKGLCLENVADELVFIKNENSERLGMSFRPYLTIMLWSLGAILILFIFKGFLPTKFPAYKKMLERLPQSAFLSGHSVPSITLSIGALFMLIVIFLELAFLFTN